MGLGRIQCVQIGPFLKILSDNFLTKVAQKIANFFGYYVKPRTYVKTFVATLWAFLETFGLLFSPTSGHTKCTSDR